VVSFLLAFPPTLKYKTGQIQLSLQNAKNSLQKLLKKNHVEQRNQEKKFDENTGRMRPEWVNRSQTAALLGDDN
jgi:predicted RNA-binding protein with RPS1 domain